MDARIVSAIAHASIIFPGIGILVPVIIWSFRKKYSNFVRNQALQALVFQLVQWIWIQLITLLVFSAVFIYALISTASRLTPAIYSGRMLTASLISILAIAIGWVFYLLFGVIGSVVCLSGRSFQYPLLGNWIHKYVSRLNGNSTVQVQDKEYKDLVTRSEGQFQDAIGNELREDQLVAAAAHGSILIPILGFLVPLILALFDKEKTSISRFQVLQALIFQMIGQVSTFVLFGCQLIMTVGIGGPLALFNSAGQTYPNEQVLLGIGSLIILLMAINAFVLLISPLFATLGIIASVQVLRGKQFHYPFLGSWLVKRMMINEPFR
jgi:uncharacterized Tic20 family protein